MATRQGAPRALKKLNKASAQVTADALSPEQPALFVLDSTNTVTFVDVDSNVFHSCSPFA
jgi:hypothetical protein